MNNLKEIINRMLHGPWSFPDRKAVAGHKKVVDFLFNIWLNAPDYTSSDQIDAKKLLVNIESSCFGNNSGRPAGLKRRWLPVAISFSAACLLIGLITVPLSSYLKPTYIITRVSSEDTLTLILPDSSVVWLNAGSELRYRKDFLNDRKLFLDGEGFFDVKKKEGTPFRVCFGDAFIQVKGTTFNIKAAGDVSEVTLISGAIDFGIKGCDTLFFMNPEDRITYHATKKSIDKTSVKSELYDWRTGEYIFSDKTLSEVIRIMKDLFDVEVRNDTRNKEDDLFTGVIRIHEPIMDFVEKLCISMDIQIKEENNTIIFY